MVNNAEIIVYHDKGWFGKSQRPDQFIGIALEISVQRAEIFPGCSTISAHNRLKRQISDNPVSVPMTNQGLDEQPNPNGQVIYPYLKLVKTMRPIPSDGYPVTVRWAQP